MARRSIDTSDDLIDSRDVIERIEELRPVVEEEYREYVRGQQAEEIETDDPDKPPEAPPPAELLPIFQAPQTQIEIDPTAFSRWLEDDASSSESEEYRILVTLQDEFPSAQDFRDGVTFVNEGYFTEYAEQYASDAGLLQDGQHWPYNHIDWDAAADDLQSDFSSIEIGGYTFYYRG